MGKFQNTGYSQRIGGYVPYDVEWIYQDSWKDDWWNDGGRRFVAAAMRLVRFRYGSDEASPSKGPGRF